ncbi:MAG: DUF305 domain-containing protein [Chloroflexota bacterium]|nr:DUF305 domain-containing protein [Chloroflexota bacterium]
MNRRQSALIVILLLAVGLLTACSGTTASPASTDAIGTTEDAGNMAGRDHSGVAMDEMGMVEELAALEGEAFEIAFIDTMIPHHEGAIEMAELVPTRTDRPELNAVAQAILDAQRTENEQFAAWIETWSGDIDQ